MIDICSCSRLRRSEVGSETSGNVATRNRKRILWPVSQPAIVPDSAKVGGGRVAPYLVRALLSGGTGGIRTPGALRLVRFQGGCNRPLCHRSVHQVSEGLRSSTTSLSPARPIDSASEKCQRGRMGCPAKALTGVTRSVGSNPTFSATRNDRDTLVSRSSRVSRPSSCDARLRH